MENSDNESKLKALKELNSDYKNQLELLSKKNEALRSQVECIRNPKRRKKTTSMDIEDDEDALTDTDLNTAARSQNLFEDSSVQVFSPKNSSAENTSNHKPLMTPTKPSSPQPWDIFNKTPKKVSPPVEPKSTIFKTPSKNSASKQRRVLALYSPKSRKLIVSPLKDLPKRVPLTSGTGWTSKRAASCTNLKNSMSFIQNSNKENKALIQSRLVFPRNEGNSYVLDSGEETFCDEIQSSQKSPGPRHNKTKRIK